MEDDDRIALSIKEGRQRFGDGKPLKPAQEVDNSMIIGLRVERTFLFLDDKEIKFVLPKDTRPEQFGIPKLDGIQIDGRGKAKVSGYTLACPGQKYRLVTIFGEVFHEQKKIIAVKG